MPALYAEEFAEIPSVLARNPSLRGEVDALAATEPMPGKVTEGGGRLEAFRSVLRHLIAGDIGLEAAYIRVEQALPRPNSPHAGNNRVFPHDWGERLVRTQLSRCYNQAVMEGLLAVGETSCHVPHSQAESVESACSEQLAGGNHDLQLLYDRLIRSYREGEWSREVKVPNHPHCTHTVVPPR